MPGARAQLTRLLALVPYLQAHPEGVALDAAAERFGVPTTQIVRDLNVLWFCGLPGLGPGDLIDIDMDALDEGGDGVVRLSNADYLSRPLRFGSTEASALMLALRAMRESSPEDSRGAIDSALVKLEAAASQGAAAEVVDVPSHHAALAPLRRGLESAIEAGHQVRLDYFVPSRDQYTERVVDPIALLDTDGHAYLDAWCHLAEARRTFRLDRVQDWAELDVAAASHDIAPRDLSESLFEPSPEDLLATLRLAPPARWVAEYYPVESRTERRGGVLEVGIRTGDPTWLVRLVHRLAPHAELTGPPDLVERVADQARSTLDLYAD